MIGKDNTIRKAVMTEVKSRISLAEDEFETVSKEHDAEYDERVAHAETQRETARQDTIDRLVTDILGTPKK